MLHHKSLEPGQHFLQVRMCAPSEDSIQLAHLHILIRVFLVRLRKLWDHAYPKSALQRLSKRTVQSNLSSLGAHVIFVGNTVHRLMIYCSFDCFAFAVRVFLIA